jgi:hypothetical protein
MISPFLRLLDEPHPPTNPQRLSGPLAPQEGADQCKDDRAQQGNGIWQLEGSVRLSFKAFH